MSFFDLAPLKDEELLSRAQAWATRVVTTLDSIGSGRGHGEGPEHERLKNYVRTNPASIGLNNWAHGEIEHSFPSMDSIDVLFRRDEYCVIVEVKPRQAPLDDILRGIFQLQKYEALLRLEELLHGRTVKIQKVLALGGALPQLLDALPGVLGIAAYQKMTAI